MGGSFIERYATPEEKEKIFSDLRRKMINKGYSERDADLYLMQYYKQAKQYKDDKPKWGFTWNCYFPVGMGKFYQESVKDKILETGIHKAWDGTVRYRCGGINRLVNLAKKNPEELFQYDDEFLATLNDALKNDLRADITGNYAKRKRDFINKFIDITMTLLLEDTYYRVRSKSRIKRLIDAFKDKEHLLELDEREQKHFDKWAARPDDVPD